MTNKMVLIITTTKFKVTVYLTFKEAFDIFTTFVLSHILNIILIVYNKQVSHFLPEVFDNLENGVNGTVYL